MAVLHPTMQDNYYKPHTHHNFILILLYLLHGLPYILHSIPSDQCN
jgi:hypothetical protein